MCLSTAQHWLKPFEVRADHESLVQYDGSTCKKSGPTKECQWSVPTLTKGSNMLGVKCRFQVHIASTSLPLSVQKDDDQFEKLIVVWTSSVWQIPEDTEARRSVEGSIGVCNTLAVSCASVGKPPKRPMKTTARLRPTSSRKWCAWIRSTCWILTNIDTLRCLVYVLERCTTWHAW